VALFREVLLEISRRRQLHFRLATISSDVERETVVAALRSDRLSPCGQAPVPSEEGIRACSQLVAQMGTGPMISALNAGADVIVAGRACDTAIFAAFPIARGYDPALALHAAKIAECGTLCAEPGGANDSLLVTLDEESFVVEPTNACKRCLPHTVAAHSLYEQPSPHEFVEPEGTVDMRGCTFTVASERAVRVSGTRLIPPERARVKIEGSRRIGCRSLTIAGTCDPLVIENLDAIECAVREKVRDMTADFADAGHLQLRFLRYGLDALSAPVASGRHLPSEVGLVIEAVAPSRELADSAVSLARSTALHQGFSGRKTTAGNFAFPFSPSDVRAGDVYEFAVYHLMSVDDVDALFPVTIEDV
jgi:hypothetical protein